MRSSRAFGRTFFEMGKPSDLIRLFGMSGLLATDELRNIESQYGIELGHTQKLTAESALAYYPQFEKKLRLEAAAMARHYELFYCLENAIRILIAETLQESTGLDWWNSGRVPESVRKEVGDRVKRDVDSGMTRRSDAAIDYTNLANYPSSSSLTGMSLGQSLAANELSNV